MHQNYEYTVHVQYYVYKNGVSNTGCTVLVWVKFKIRLSLVFYLLFVSNTVQCTHVQYYVYKMESAIQAVQYMSENSR